MAGEQDGQAAEQEVFVPSSERRVQKGKIASFFEFLYDKNTGKVLGRTGCSWLEITIFYIIFYSGLVAFWAICLAVFVQTLDPKVPRYYGKGTIIGVNPGMGYQPWLRNDPESTLIHFNMSDNSTYEKYVKQMDAIFQRYLNQNATRECGKDASNADEDPMACRLDLEPFSKTECTSMNQWGYKDGRPCVLVRLNRLIGWEPIPYPKDSAPQVVKERYNYETNDVAVDCEGEYYADQENIGKLKYIPKSGLGRKYFPYKVMENYHQPIAMVQFRKPAIGILVEVECKAFAYNIIHDRADRQGMVHFELLVDR